MHIVIATFFTPLYVNLIAIKVKGWLLRWNILYNLSYIIMNDVCKNISKTNINLNDTII